MKELIDLAEKSTTYKRNEFLKVGGTVDTNVYYVVSGSIRVFYLNEGIEQTLRFGYQKNIIASLDSFFTGQPSDLFIQALKKSVVKIISRQQIEAFLITDSNRVFWQKVLENPAVEQVEREIDLLTDSPQKRYQRVMNRSPQLFQEIPKKHIANYLRMSPETLSRLKKS
ncbi:MAG: Crp/Fnr family transcriptional regulator [Saprospirales bacterium]|nr:MAG: Crp/Fnr family transcriptional regulator [Saprospirales bacterium]